MIASAGPVTEAEAIRLFLEHSPQARRPALAVRSVEADLRVETRIANPEFAWQVEDAAGVRDEFMTIQQELPISGRRALLGTRATLASTAAGLSAEGDLQAQVYALRAAFYEVLYREEVIEQVQQGVALMGRTVEILQEREREGEGSGYDFLRAEQELGQLQVMAIDARAALVAARSRFGAFHDPDLEMDQADLDGDLVPVGTVPGIEQAVEQALSQRLDLQALASERERLDLEQRAARRRRIPEPTLTAGWKRTEALGVSDGGYVAALMVPLPLFQRGRQEASRALAEGNRVDLETEILARQVRAEVQAAVAREHAAREAARIRTRNAEMWDVELSRIAGLRYDEGESGILELLDAHRTTLEMQLQALAAQYQARSAEIERDYVIGNEVKP